MNGSKKVSSVYVYFNMDMNSQISSFNFVCVGEMLKYNVKKDYKFISLEVLPKYFDEDTYNFIRRVISVDKLELSEVFKIVGIIKKEFINNLRNIQELKYSQLYLGSDKNKNEFVCVGFGRELMLFNTSMEDLNCYKEIINKTLIKIGKVRNENVNLIDKQLKLGEDFVSKYIRFTVD